MPLDAPQLVAAAMKAVGVKPHEQGSNAALAKYLRFDKPGYGPQRVGRWLNGKARPDYEQTIALLEMVGWLDKTPGTTRPAAADRRVVHAVQAIADGLAELESLVPEQERPAHPGRRAAS